MHGAGRQATILAFALALLSACETDTDAVAPTPPRTTTTAVAGPSTTPGPRTVKWVELHIGDCIAQVPQVELGEVTVTIVDCASPHAAEVYFRAPVAVNAAIPDVANRECGAAFSEYTGQSMGADPLTVTWLVDSNQDRTTIAPTVGPAPSNVICLLQNANGEPLMGSARR